MLDTVRAGGVTGFRRLLRSHGADPVAILASVGIDHAWLDDPDRQIPYRKVLSALEQAAAELRIPDLGVQLAEMQDLSILGPLSLAVQAADSLRSGLIIMIRHMHFHTPGLAFELRPGPPGCETVSMRFLLADLPPMRQATEHAVAHLVRMAPLLTAGAVTPRAIHFRHPPQGSEALYRRHFEQMPHFGSTFDGVVFDEAQLRRPIATHNPTLQSFVEHYLIGMAPPSELPMVQQVRSTIATMLQVGPVGLGDVARVLRLQPRTLQRRLRAEGLSFAQLVEQARRDLADRLLAQPTLPLSRISQMLGFADQAVFTRACRRWFGTTPLDRRRALLTRRPTSIAT